MPDNQIPVTQPAPDAAPGEFNFAKPAEENPRIKRRSLKVKPEGLLKPARGTPPAARELEREAPPLPAEQPHPVKPRLHETGETQTKPTVKVAETSPAPPRTTPSLTTTPSQPASGTPASKAAATPAPTSTVSPHGTRPATLYYSSHLPKDQEAPTLMKTIPTTRPASSSSTMTPPASVARSATSSPRPTAPIDYRTNVERQSREQKSVGGVLSILVYTLIGFFVVGAALAGYGAYVVSAQLHQQSVTVSDVDARYAAATKDLTAKLATTQDTLGQAQAQIARQQDLIVRQQEELNRLIAATTDNVNALKLEKQARTQETAGLRARLRDLELRPATPQKF